LRQYLSLENDCILIKQIQDKAIQIIDGKWCLEFCKKDSTAIKGIAIMILKKVLGFIGILSTGIYLFESFSVSVIFSGISMCQKITCLCFYSLSTFHLPASRSSIFALKGLNIA